MRDGKTKVTAGKRKKSGGSSPARAGSRGEAPGTTRVKVLASEWDEARQKAGEAGNYLDLLQRCRADFDNYRKRINRDRGELAQAARGELACEMLPVLDNLERALAVAQDSHELAAFLDGVEMIRKQFVEALSRNNITPIKAAGQAFDPELHEAVEEVDSDVIAPGTVVEEVLSGYRMGERVLRPAAVKVARAPQRAGSGCDKDTGCDEAGD